ncbi:hypothetical protein BpHYR1_014822 [Brachionus plicatilis]|uniref:Uncharacterized protein n=1 Tax=Brachionus plicatilis TaxID=10195 RepID=A0A3M7Q6M5_BRAPC|nr:hypothetical protein BpHYR1_014822 [Brachionus plicatilis]
MLQTELQLKNSSISCNLLVFFIENYKTYDQKNTSLCKQLSNTSIALIDHLFLENNRGLVDSVKFVVSQKN